MKPAIAGVARALWAHVHYANYALVCLLCFAVSLQVLITLEIDESLLRVAVSDLLLPMSFATLFFQRRFRATLPQVCVPWFWSGIGILTIWMLVAVVNGYVVRGHWSQWALLNKGAGWFVLLGYLFIGTSLGNLADRQDTRRFVGLLLLFAAFSSLISLLLWVGYRNGLDIYLDDIANYTRPRGFAQNTNAYGVLLVTVVVSSLPLLDVKRGPRHLGMCFAVALCLAVVFLTGSRSAFLGLLVGGAGLIATRALNGRTIVHIVFLTSIVTAAAIHSTTILNNLVPWETRDSGTDSVYILQRPPLEAGSDQHRASNILSALKQWSEAPALGIGLGSFYESQIEAMKTREANDGPQWNAPSVLHNTAVWVLVETGLIGLFIFSSFFLYVAVRVYQAARTEDIRPWRASALGMLLAFMGSSIGTEVLYQRHFWFIFGVMIAVCLPSNGRITTPPDGGRGASQQPAAPRRLCPWA